MEAKARERAEDVLRRIAEAEAHVHGTTVEAVHFHEVGAVDTIVDVCGAAFALECLEVDRVLSTPPYAGGGTVHCAHGEMPVPAPGTAAILGDLAWSPGVGGERLTPTGAALYASFARPMNHGSSVRAKAVGYGSGKRDPKEGPPNLVRVQLAEEGAPASASETRRPCTFTPTRTGTSVRSSTSPAWTFAASQSSTIGAMRADSSSRSKAVNRPAIALATSSMGRPRRRRCENRAVPA